MKLDTSKLSADSKRVLAAAIDSMAGNGFDFGFSDSIVFAGWPKGKVGGHLADLSNKGILTLVHDRGDDLIEPAGEPFSEERDALIGQLEVWRAQYKDEPEAKYFARGTLGIKYGSCDRIEIVRSEDGQVVAKTDFSGIAKEILAALNS